MTAVVQSRTKPFPQAVVSEPAIANDKDVVVGEFATDLGDHVSSLFNFGLKLDLSFSDLDRLIFKVLFLVVEAGGKRDAGPALFDMFEQADCNDVLSPEEFGLVMFGGVVEEIVTAIDFFAEFWIHEVIEGENQALLSGRIRDEFPDSVPHLCQGKLG